MLARVERLTKSSLAWKSQWLEMDNFELLVELTSYPYMNMVTVTESLLSPLLTEPALYAGRASWVEKESPVAGWEVLA